MNKVEFTFPRDFFNPYLVDTKLGQYCASLAFLHDSLAVHDRKCDPLSALSNMLLRVNQRIAFRDEISSHTSEYSTIIAWVVAMIIVAKKKEFIRAITNMFTQDKLYKKKRCEMIFSLVTYRSVVWVYRV